MKTLYLISGTMGVGKTTVCEALKKELNNSVFLDGDWCWNSNPFNVTEETRVMVIDNICYLLNNFIHCTAYKHIIFCWVMHEQSIIDRILSKIDTSICNIKLISLICDEASLKKRLKKDIEQGIRSKSITKRSIPKLYLYNNLNTIKIDTTNKDVCLIVKEIIDI